MKKLLFLLSFIFISFSAFAQTPFGLWKTIDDETGAEKAYVRIYEENGKMYGKIEKLLNKPMDTVCDQCPGEKKDKPLVGMMIISDMEKDGDTWDEGTILKPENGKIYDGKIWLENGKLMVRGYIGFLFKTQEWLRVE